MRIEEILINQITKSSTGIELNQIKGVYLYGSRLYGTNTSNSDWDFVVINSAGVDYDYISDEVDIQFIAVETYKNMLLEHDVIALEVIHQNIYGDPIKEYDCEFQLDLVKLRKSFSSKASNSFVKFKKKLTVESGDTNRYIAIKSLFHALRIAELGYQLASGSKGFLLSKSNFYWNKIVLDAERLDYNWDELYKIYKPAFNSEMSEFRRFAPKKKNDN